MTWSLADMPDQSGKVAAVTGSNAGLGFEIASALAHGGARVVMACRTETKALAAMQKILATSPKGTVEFMQLDLGDLSSVRAFASQLTDTVDRLDILGNNAGLMAIDKSTTVDGFETQLGVNHLGHFALTGQLLPLLLATPSSRVVNHSSFAHRPGKLHRNDPMFTSHRYGRWTAYFQSKLANLLFTFELQRRLHLAGSTTISLAAHPGASHTDLGVEGSGPLNKLVGPLGRLYTQSAARGALPFIRACTDPSATGSDFFGPRFLSWGAPKLETPTKRSRNTEDAKFLWSLSEELTNVHYLD